MRERGIREHPQPCNSSDGVAFLKCRMSKSDPIESSMNGLRYILGFVLIVSGCSRGVSREEVALSEVRDLIFGVNSSWILKRRVPTKESSNPPLIVLDYDAMVGSNSVPLVRTRPRWGSAKRFISPFGDEYEVQLSTNKDGCLVVTLKCAHHFGFSFGERCWMPIAGSTTLCP